MCTDCASVLDVFVCCIFFFKQKTAYEMRISDWSSDVCSSDLPRCNREETVRCCRLRHEPTQGKDCTGTRRHRDIVVQINRRLQQIPGSRRKILGEAGKRRQYCGELIGPTASSLLVYGTG